MEPTRQQIVDDIIHDAHNRERVVASEVAAEVLDELRNLEAGGHRWVADFIDNLLLTGVEWGGKTASTISSAAEVPPSSAAVSSKVSA